MKAIILISSFLICNFLKAQDTTQLIKYYDGTKSYWLVSKTDTLLKWDYPNGKKESVRKFKNNQITGTYTRWYENGKVMWEKSLVNNILQGYSIFYNEKGIKIAELLYEDGKIKDTVFIKKNTHLILGKATYNSKVYGGMQREDGSSNISESSGPYQNLKMYAAKVDSLKKPVLIQNFKTDFNGDFIIDSPEGKISFFPATIPITEINPGQYNALERGSMSGHSGWDYTKPFIIENQKLYSIILHHFSVGYAP